MVSTPAPDPEPPNSPGIAELVGRHTALGPRGEDQLRGTCPFCGSTAFRVRPSHGTFHCFGCGEGGDARAFSAKIGRSGQHGGLNTIGW